MKTEELAIIKDIHVGIRDTDNAMCWFTVDTIRGSALQMISFEELAIILERNDIYKLEDLEGRPCVVEREGNQVIFKKLK